MHAQVRAKADEMREVQAAQAKAETEARDRAYAESQARAEKQRKEREELMIRPTRIHQKPSNGSQKSISFWHRFGSSFYHFWDPKELQIELKILPKRSPKR